MTPTCPAVTIKPGLSNTTSKHKDNKVSRLRRVSFRVKNLLNREKGFTVFKHIHTHTHTHIQEFKKENRMRNFYQLKLIVSAQHDPGLIRNLTPYLRNVFTKT